MNQHLLVDLRATLGRFRKAISVGVDVPDYVFQESLYLALDSMILGESNYKADFTRFVDFHKNHLVPNPEYAALFKEAFDEFVNDVRGYMQGHGLYNGNGFSYVPCQLRKSTLVMQLVNPPEYFTEPDEDGN